MPQRVATERIASKQPEVCCQHQGTEPYAEPNFSRRRICEPQGFPDIPGEHKQEQQSEVKKVSMNVLQNQWKGTFAPIVLARFSDCARRGIGPEGPVVGPAIVVTGETESSRSPQN